MNDHWTDHRYRQEAGCRSDISRSLAANSACSNVPSWPKANIGNVIPKRPHDLEASDWLRDRNWQRYLNFRLLRNLQGIIDFDAKVSDAAFQLGVTKETKVLLGWL